MLTVRRACPDDLPALAALEAACFPPAEAATEASLRARLAAYPDRFLLLFSDETPGKADEPALVSFVDGPCTDSPDLEDRMYDDMSCHTPSGRWQMIFGVNTHPACRRRGYAGGLLRTLIEDCRREGREGLVLTCKPHLVGWYASFGFVDEGVSASTHGDTLWHQMRLRLP